MNKKTIIVDGFNLHIIFGKTKTEYNDTYGNGYEVGDLWDFPIEELLNGAVEPNEDIWYWLINGRLYETYEDVEK